MFNKRNPFQKFQQRKMCAYYGSKHFRGYIKLTSLINKVKESKYRRSKYNINKK